MFNYICKLLHICNTSTLETTIFIWGAEIKGPIKPVKKILISCARAGDLAESLFIFNSCVAVLYDIYRYFSRVIEKLVLSE